MPINPFTDYPMSWKPDRDALKRPLYLSLALLLEHDITNGFLAPGTKLPRCASVSVSLIITGFERMLVASAAY